MHPTKFRFIWQSGFRGDFIWLISKNKIPSETALPSEPILGRMHLWAFLYKDCSFSPLYRGPPIDATYQVSVRLAKRFQRGFFFRNQPISNKNYLWRPILTDSDSIEGPLLRLLILCHFVTIH
jgi:hypothetical protein